VNAIEQMIRTVSCKLDKICYRWSVCYVFTLVCWLVFLPVNSITEKVVDDFFWNFWKE